MTLTDIRRNILQSTNPNWFNNLEETFNFNYVDQVIPLKGVSTIYEFVLKQIDGWNKLGNDIPLELLQSKTYFEGLKSQIINFINDTQNNSEEHFQRYWNQVKTQINNTQRFPLKYNSPEVEFLLRIYQDYPKSYQSSYNFIFGTNNFNLNNKDSLIGVILAYEFTLKEVSQITKRSNAERSSLKTIKNEFERQISDAENHLSEHLLSITTKSSDFSKKIETLKTEKEQAFNDWFTNAQNKFTLFDGESNKSIKALELTYEELLRLKKPADYWKLRATELKSEGWVSLRWLIALVILGCFILYSLLWLTPEGMLKSFFNNDKSAALRWSIIFITLISFLAFGIKALTKVTFSSFHLARDAEERERLTYVYLAMVKDSSIEKEDRHLIMQSLFSRADTGLLKDDSSPTMPGSGTIIEKVFNK